MSDLSSKSASSQNQQTCVIQTTQSISKDISSTKPCSATAVIRNSLPSSCESESSTGGSNLPKPPLFEPSLPFVDEDFFKDVVDMRPAEPLLKTSALMEVSVQLPGNIVFKDRVLPPALHAPVPNQHFSVDYFVALSTMVSTSGHSWPAGTPNFRGARIELAHSSLNIPNWRRHLVG